MALTTKPRLANEFGAVETDVPWAKPVLAVAPDVVTPLTS